MTHEEVLKERAARICKVYNDAHYSVYKGEVSRAAAWEVAVNAIRENIPFDESRVNLGYVKADIIKPSLTEAIETVLAYDTTTDPTRLADIETIITHVHDLYKGRWRMELLAPAVRKYFLL